MENRGRVESRERRIVQRKKREEEWRGERRKEKWKEEEKNRTEVKK